MTAEGAGHAEFIRGVPHALPAGEHVLWEGAPDARALATHVFHRRAFFLYFGALVGWWSASTPQPFGSAEYLTGLAVRVGLSIAVMAVVEGIARICARTSWYAITNRRVVFRVGMVFPMSINIPFTVVDSADVGTFKDGTGQVRIKLGREHRLAYIALWPHCTVFSLNNPEPILRGLPDAGRIGGILAGAVADAAAVDTAGTASHSTARSARGTASTPQPVGV